jgi:hypothetical protein
MYLGKKRLINRVIFCCVCKHMPFSLFFSISNSGMKSLKTAIKKQGKLKGVNFLENVCCNARRIEFLDKAPE